MSAGVPRVPGVSVQRGSSSQSARIKSARPWLCWRLRGSEIKPNKNVWFVAFIFGRCQLQFERARCLEAGPCDKHEGCTDELLAIKCRFAPPHCFTANGVYVYIHIYIYHKEAEGIYYSSFVHLIRINYSFMLPLLLKKRGRPTLQSRNWLGLTCSWCSLGPDDAAFGFFCLSRLTVRRHNRNFHNEKNKNHHQ